MGSITVELTEAEKLYLERSVHGNGGFQGLLKRLQGNLKGNVLTLSLADCDDVVRMATRYGQGGFQGRLARLVPICNQALADFLTRSR